MQELISQRQEVMASLSKYKAKLHYRQKDNKGHYSSGYRLKKKHTGAEPARRWYSGPKEK
jgi:hypothetical protein